MTGADPEQLIATLEAIDAEADEEKLAEAYRRLEAVEAARLEARRQQLEAEAEQERRQQKHRDECLAVESERGRNRTNGQLAVEFWANWRTYATEVEQAQALGRLLFLGIETADVQQKNILARFVRMPDLSIHSQPLFGEV